MKQTAIAICLLLGFLFSFTLSACLHPEESVYDALNDYSQIVTGDIPTDLCLTIYYIDPNILTRAPVSTEDLMTFPDVKITVIESVELAEHLALLRKLDASVIKPLDEEPYVNARLCYVFEMESGSKLLEVTINDINGRVFINGYEVEHNPIFYEIIAPFLSEEDHIVLGF